ncbi:MAG: hypothetical protein NC132_00755 [Corallococcus sp.]|nr:hypothetical protein [Corallococcus sp.]MCM1359246.1 hypothetical protein [Corallococcus sp.]MCM1394637.1 hypothetical protein [Corallococcus sp.]
MTNILLNYYNFDGAWTNGRLDKYFRKKRVLIVPLAFRENQAWDEMSWQSVYGKGGEKYDNILRPFLNIGVKEYEVRWLDFFDRDTDFGKLIKDSDTLFFCGGMPEKAIARLSEIGITELVKNYDGVVAGASAGAMLQLDKYHITPDDDYDNYQLCNGLGLVCGLDLEVHYLATPLQNECTERAARELSRPVYQIWHEGGLLVEKGVVETLGNVNLVMPK